MAVFNGELYLKEAIDSVLNQTMSDFEFIIIDDHSNDESLMIINSYKDSRIHLLQNEQNMGLAASLNCGIKIAKAPLIARMDADDVMIPNRLEIQVNYLEKNTNIGVCGSFAIQIDGDSKVTGMVKTPTGLHLQFAKWIPSPVIHPTVLMRAELLRNNLYNESLKSAQDYDLWLRLIVQGVQFYNCKTPLLKYRVHAKSITQSKLLSQSRNAYDSFVRHTGLDIVSYKSFLSFCLQNYSIDLFTRITDAFLIRKVLKLNYLGLFINQFRYIVFKYVLAKKNMVKL